MTTAAHLISDEESDLIIAAWNDNAVAGERASSVSDCDGGRYK